MPTPSPEKSKQYEFYEAEEVPVSHMPPPETKITDVYHVEGFAEEMPETLIRKKIFEFSNKQIRIANGDRKSGSKEVVTNKLHNLFHTYKTVDPPQAEAVRKRVKIKYGINIAKL